MAIHTTVRMSSFSWEDCRFASTSRKQLADTWRVSGCMNCGQNPVCMLQTPQMARPTTSIMKLCGASNRKWLKHGYLNMVMKMKLMSQTCQKYAQIVPGEKWLSHSRTALQHSGTTVLRSKRVRIWSTYVDMVQILYSAGLIQSWEHSFM